MKMMRRNGTANESVMVMEISRPQIPVSGQV